MRRKQNELANNPKADPRLTGTQKQRNMQKAPDVAGLGRPKAAKRGQTRREGIRKCQDGRRE